VKVGHPATVTLEALPGRAFAGEVVEVGASALPLVGTGAAAREFKVKVRVKDPQEGLRPGLTGDAEILVGEAKDALAVPSRRSSCGARRAASARASSWARARPPASCRWRPG